MSDNLAKNDRSIKLRGQLDLGLSKLLDDDPKIDIGPYLEHLRESRSVQVDGSQPQDEEAISKSEYEILAEAESWCELTKLTEKQLSEGEDPETKLWWIRAHLKAGSIPVSILAAPLGSVYKELISTSASEKESSSEGRKKILKLVELTLYEVGVALKNGGERSLALSYLIKADTLNPEYAEELLEAVSEEVSELEKQIRRKKTPELISQKEHLSLLRRDLLSRETRSQTNGNGGDISEEEGAAITDVDRDAPNSNYPHFRQVRHGAAILALLGIVLSGVFYAQSSGVSASNYALAVEGSVYHTERTPSMMLPTVSRVSKSIGPSLLGILDTLDNRPVIKKVSTLKSVPLASRGMSVNTIGPVEPDKLREVRQQPQRGEERDPKISVGTMLGDPVFRGERPGDTIVKGYPSLLKGSAAVSFAESSQNKKFKVVRDTDVRQHPSEDAPVISVIHEGRAIMVAERMGNWLKILSNTNKVGYVPSASIAR